MGLLCDTTSWESLLTKNFAEKLGDGSGPRMLNYSIMRLIFVGGGRFAAELYGWMKISGHLEDYSQICYLSPDKSSLELNYLGKISTSQLHATDKLILAIGDIKYREEAIVKLEEVRSSFISYIHPTCLVNIGVKMGIGTVMLPHSLISAYASIGDFAFLNVYSSIGHDCLIGDNLVMSPYSAITGNCTLGDNVYVGTHSSTIPGRKIGNNVKLSAGSLALKHIPEGHILMGPVNKAIKL